MKSNGTLIKLAGSPDAHQTALAAAVPSDYEIKPLFAVTSETRSGNQAAAAAAATCGVAAEVPAPSRSIQSDTPSRAQGMFGV